MPKRTENRDSHKSLHTSVHSSITYNSQKVETTQMSICRWCNKQIVEDYSTIERKCGYMLQHGWTSKSWCQVKEAKRKRSHTVWFHLCEISRISKSRDRKQLGDCRRLRGAVSNCLVGTGFYFVMKMFWNHIEVVAAHHCEDTKHH